MIEDDGDIDDVCDEFFAPFLLIEDIIGDIDTTDDKLFASIPLIEDGRVDIDEIFDKLFEDDRGDDDEIFEVGWVEGVMGLVGVSNLVVADVCFWNGGVSTVMA